MSLAEDKDSASGYSLGHDDEEIRRLQEQSLFLEPFTRRCLLEAKIQPGMKVLDVGTGAGDVALLLARLVGPAGEVLGVDRNPTVLDVARRRAQNAGLNNVSFKAGDVHQLEADSDFDAVTGRLILFHLKEPAVVLRKLVTYLKPGGLVVFQDYNLGTLDLLSGLGPARADQTLGQRGFSNRRSRSFCGAQAWRHFPGGRAAAASNDLRGQHRRRVGVGRL